MATRKVAGAGTKESPWQLTTPIGSSEYQMYRDESASPPVGGWYGLKKGLRGRFGMDMPSLLEALGPAEVEHNPKNNRMRAL
ncbi:MAG TPA: hypothetical protein VGK42_08535 [Candidatus Dormibacteraeota bacterium]